MAKRLLITFAIISFALSFITFMLQRHAVDTSLSNWHSGFNGFISANLAQQENQKPILLFFYTDWCTNCEALRENILATPEVKSFLNNIIPVKVNPEVGKLENQIAEEFGVQGYPTLFVVSAQQKTQSIRGLSNITPEEFIQKCQASIRSLI